LASTGRINKHAFDLRPTLVAQHKRTASDSAHLDPCYEKPDPRLCELVDINEMGLSGG